MEPGPSASQILPSTQAACSSSWSLRLLPHSYTLLKEYHALHWVDFHLLIFGVLFMAIVLALPGGLVDLADRVMHCMERQRTSAVTR